MRIDELHGTKVIAKRIKAIEYACHRLMVCVQLDLAGTIENEVIGWTLFQSAQQPIEILF